MQAIQLAESKASGGVQNVDLTELLLSSPITHDKENTSEPKGIDNWDMDMVMLMISIKAKGFIKSLVM